MKRLPKLLRSCRSFACRQGRLKRLAGGEASETSFGAATSLASGDADAVKTLRREISF